MKLTLTKVFRTKKDKAGNPLKTKDGRAYERISIKAEEYGDRYLSGFGGGWNDNWNEGDIVNANVEEVQGKDGKEYLNFSKLDPMEDFEARLKLLEDKVFGNTDAPDVHVDDDDVPF